MGFSKGGGLGGWEGSLTRPIRTHGRNVLSLFMERKGPNPQAPPPPPLDLLQIERLLLDTFGLCFIIVINVLLSIPN